MVKTGIDETRQERSKDSISGLLTWRGLPGETFSGLWMSKSLMAPHSNLNTHCLLSTIRSQKPTLRVGNSIRELVIVVL